RPHRGARPGPHRRRRHPRRTAGHLRALPAPARVAVAAAVGMRDGMNRQDAKFAKKTGEKKRRLVVWAESSKPTACLTPPPDPLPEAERERGGGVAPRFAVLLLGALGTLAVSFLFFHRLGERDLWSSHEARAAMDAQSLLDQGGVL